MRLRPKSVIALIIVGTLSSFSGCHDSGNSSPANQVAEPGTAAQQCTSSPDDADTIKKCDSKRKELRKTAMEFLGIDALQINSDKVLKQISPNNLEKVVKDAIEYNAKDTSSDTAEDDLSEISDIINAAALEAELDPASTTIVPGTSPARVLHIGHPDYLDGKGNFSVGSAHLQNISGNKVGDIYAVILGVGLNPDPSKSFQAYSIGLEQITETTHDATAIIPLSDYVEKQLPCFCQGTKSQLDPQLFNTIAVGASEQPTNN